MTFGRSVRVCICSYATFTGRASRGEFWRFFLFVQLVRLGAGFIDTIVLSALLGLVLGSSVHLEPIGTLVISVFWLPFLAVGARRLHDIGKSGWWQLLYATPLLYGLYAMMPFSDLMVSDSFNIAEIIIANTGIIILLIMFAFPTNGAGDKYTPEKCG